MCNQPLVAVVIVHWGSLKATDACIESLRLCNYYNMQLILVDNDPNQRFWKKEKGKDDKLVYILNETNTGYTGGNNTGILKALELNAKYICILNNDTIIDENLLNDCASFMESNYEIDILSPKILYHEYPSIINAAGGEIDLKSGERQIYGNGLKDNWRFEIPKDITFLVGCAFFARSSIFEKVGLFDQKLFCYCEDDDLSIRLIRADKKIRYFPKSKVWHKHTDVNIEQKVNLPTSYSVYYTWRNKLYILNQKMPEKKFISYIYFLFRFFWILGIYSLKYFRPDLCLAMVIGLFDSLMNRMGKRDYSIFYK